MVFDVTDKDKTGNELENLVNGSVDVLTDPETIAGTLAMCTVITVVGGMINAHDVGKLKTLEEGGKAALLAKGAEIAFKKSKK